MKLKFERFEGLACLSLRGPIEPPHHKVLEVGLETLAKELKETLVVNLRLATFSDAITLPYLIEIKKKISALTQFKIHWISTQRGLGDFSAIDVFTSRLTGSKSRQIGERIHLDDEIYSLQLETLAIEKKILERGGDVDRAQAIILENRTLKEQSRILKQSIVWQEARLKLQSKQISFDSDLESRTQEAEADFKKANTNQVDL